MKRQVVIGGLVGVALGGLLTASFAHGLLQWHGRDEAGSRSKDEAVEGPASEPDEAAAVGARSDGRFVRPLRPGGETTGHARAKAAQIAAVPTHPSRPAV